MSRVNCDVLLGIDREVLNESKLSDIKWIRSRDRVAEELNSDTRRPLFDFVCYTFRFPGFTVDVETGVWEWGMGMGYGVWTTW